MERTNNLASVVTVVALLLTVQYSTENADLWDAVLSTIAGVVFWSTRKEWVKDGIVRAIISSGIGVSIAILYSVAERAFEIINKFGLKYLYKEMNPEPEPYEFMDNEIGIALGVAIAIFAYTTKKYRG